MAKVATPISSEYESDEGASPSVSDSELSSSSGSSDPNLKIVCPTFSTPKKRPVSATTRNAKKRNSVSISKAPNVSNTSAKKGPPNKKPRPLPSKMRLRSSDASNKTRNKRRRTKSERNRQAGKPDNSLEVPGSRAEDAVALDAEIDRVLEEKAVKNNLTATNVKSIIRQVITNNMVRRMIVQTVRNKGNLDGNGSSEDETFYEPTLTRAKTKELLEKKSSPLWPLVATPVKVLKKPSETHMLINQDLPEDSSGDEEYVPQEMDHISEDESGSITTSDVGSPMVATPKDEGRHYPSIEFDVNTPKHNSMFKTPPPKRKPKSLVDSAIGLRTRSKLPLTDTTIETLEMQLIPPDITTDMYHWGESDNEDYLAFLKDFLRPAQVHNENNDDDEADPEYNVMEEEEDDHDKEEHRMDRAVKVSKKELNELVAELFDTCHLSSGDEIDDFHVMQNATSGVDSSYNQSIPIYDRNTDGSFTIYERPSYIAEQQNTSPKVEQKLLMSEKETPNCSSIISIDCIDAPRESIPQSVILSMPSLDKENENLEANVKTSCKLFTTHDEQCETGMLFTKDGIEKLRHQLRQHIQLLAQSYVLTASRDKPVLKSIAHAAKNMIMSLVRLADGNGSNSVFAVDNLKYVSQICSQWPQSSNVKSPIKKKILEERFMNDEENGESSDFPHKVIKLIAESPAFMYPHLLPDRYNLECKHNISFSNAEDSLIVLCYEQTRTQDGKFGYNTKEMSVLIADVVLPGRSAEQIYGRIRNMKRSSYRENVIQKYFNHLSLPLPVYKGLDEKTAIAPKDQPITKFSHLWNNIITRLTYRPISLLSPSRKRPRKKFNFDSTTLSRKSEKPVIQKNLPIEHSPDVTPIALLNSVGHPGAYILIPNYALQPQNGRGTELESPSIQAEEMKAKDIHEIVNVKTGLSPDKFATEEALSPEKSQPIQGDLEGNSCARAKIYIRKTNSVRIKSNVSDNDEPQGCFGMLVTESEESEEECHEGDFPSRDVSSEIIDLASDVQESDTQSTSQGKSSKDENTSKDSKTHQSDELRPNDSKGGSGGKGGNGNGGDEDDDKDQNKYRATSVAEEDIDDNAKKEDTDEDEHEDHSFNKKRSKDSSPSRDTVKATKMENTGRPSKKLKRSPAGPSKKRPSKYNVPSAEKLLEEVEHDYHTQAEIEDAFTDGFIAKVQSTIEPKCPAIYNAFVQLLCDHGENPSSELQLYSKVAILLKDFPDLVKEFGSMLRENSPGNELYDFEYSQETQAQINFMTLLTKWTADSPQLRNKVLQKIKLLREDPKMSEKDVIDMADNLFLGNSVMIKAFQDLFLEIFRPQPIDNSTDFEEIDLEMEESLDSGDDIHIEIVKIPEETAVPATSTCPCVCHLNKSNVSYASRSKHCNKCSLKFQEGKVFVHHGRVMRPVNIAMASPGSAKKIIAGTACVRCVQTPPKAPICVKESPSPPVKRQAKVSAPNTSTDQRLPEECAGVSDAAVEKLGDDNGELEEGEIIDEEEVKAKCDPESGSVYGKSLTEIEKRVPIEADEKPSTSASARHDNTGNANHDVKLKVWTMEEDKLILNTCQAERTFNVGLDKLENLITYRTKEEIKGRLIELINLLQKAVRSGKMEAQGKGNDQRK